MFKKETREERKPFFHFFYQSTKREKHIFLGGVSTRVIKRIIFLVFFFSFLVEKAFKRKKETKTVNGKKRIALKKCGRKTKISGHFVFEQKKQETIEEGFAKTFFEKKKGER